jgi:hypothetical protein
VVHRHLDAELTVCGSASLTIVPNTSCAINDFLATLCQRKSDLHNRLDAVEAGIEGFRFVDDQLRVQCAQIRAEHDELMNGSMQRFLSILNEKKRKIGEMDGVLRQYTAKRETQLQRIQQLTKQESDDDDSDDDNPRPLNETTILSNVSIKHEAEPTSQTIPATTTANPDIELSTASQPKPRRGRVPKPKEPKQSKQPKQPKPQKEPKAVKQPKQPKKPRVQKRSTTIKSEPTSSDPDENIPEPAPFNYQSSPMSSSSSLEQDYDDSEVDPSTQHHLKGKTALANSQYPDLDETQCSEDEKF